jgi:polysaccharide biosynthesis/export protein
MNIEKSILFILVLIILTSCSTKKDILYFNTVASNQQDQVVFSPGKIQSNDILSILISSSSSELAALYNLNQSPNSFTGYLVSNEGTITLPVLGEIKASSLTLKDLEKMLVKKLKDENHLTNPIVTVRLMNAKFTVLGEVNKPGTYNFSEENISVLQALGYAGDLTINGVRKDILIIREENNNKTYAKIDLTSKDWFNSPYYYIKPNDVIYVNPNGAKVKSAGYVGSLGNFLTIVSIGVSTILTILVVSK